MDYAFHMNSAKKTESQLWPVKMALLTHSITTLLQQAKTYHILIARFIFG